MDKPLIYGVLGYPVKHSLSPLMHNAAFRALKINAEYKLFEVAPPQLKDFLRGLAEKNIAGLNVTVPHKEAAVPFMDSVSAEAKLIGAVNTVKASGGKLEGFNTDGAGFLRHLAEDLKFNPQGKIIAILGAGGASRAICVYLAKEKPKKISLYDIDQSKSAALINRLKNNFPDIDFQAADAVAGLGIAGCDLLINASPAGMKESDPSPVDENLFHKGLLAYDLIYNPARTKFLKTAQTKGCRTAGGLGMLLYQGMLSFAIWTGRPAPREIMRQALEEGLKNAGDNT